MKKIVNLISFYNDIEGIVRQKPTFDVRVLILYIDLYMEHYLLFICKKMGVKGTLKERCKALLSKGVLEKRAYNLIKLIIDLRNKLVHSITVTIEDVNKKLENMELLFHTDNAELLKAVSSSNDWQKFHVYSVLLVAVLYMIACEQCKIEPNYNIRPEVKMNKDGKVTWKVVLLKKNKYAPSGH
ncbi:hypothetical protein HQ533_03050 [Candidatus Woesearchaeota archaeon]|nr:hypothetical protein [Candidatus Woesearchaeota archaeon]